MKKQPIEHIKCISCRFARPDKSAGDKSRTAYECGNEKSEFHKALLNVTHNGEKQARITWRGCKYGERRVAV